MESASTVNSWVEQLALSLLSTSSSANKVYNKRSLDNFRRRLRHHTHTRTNQFDVSDQLDGLEEKFQVLSRNDLSDALYARRVELKAHQERWIPDVLDLLLRLSDDPIHKTELANASKALPISDVPERLRWADIEADDPVDRHDPIWRKATFSDLSSDEDEIDASTTKTSPASVKQRRSRLIQKSDGATNRDAWCSSPDTSEADLDHFLQIQSSQPRTLTVIQFIRNMLHAVQGYDTSIFQYRNGKLHLSESIKLESVTNEALTAITQRIATIRNAMEALKDWIQNPSPHDYVQSIKQMMGESMQNYLLSISFKEEDLLQPETVLVASISETVLCVEELAIPLRTLANYVYRNRDSDGVHILNSLYELVCDLYFSNDTEALGVTFPIFAAACGLYLERLQAWVGHGEIDESFCPFFVRSKERSHGSRLWHDYYEVDEIWNNRGPKFLTDLVPEIFNCGKTVAFINQILPTVKTSVRASTRMRNLQFDLETMTSDLHVPFPAALSHMLKSHFSSLLASNTLILKDLLNTRCGMERTFAAFEHIYLRREGALLDTFEDKIFARIDKCKETWNDRFLLMEMLDDTYRGFDCIDIHKITVQSTHTSSRSMESRRRSVRILGALAIDYSLPWLIANIVSKSSMASYRRIALHLLQIRRAKYSLDNTAFLHIQSNPISTNPKHQLLAHTTAFMLLNFTNTLYDHFTTSIALPMTTKMRADLRAATTVDAMIAVHESYITNLEFACLTNKQLQMLRDTLIGLLDMCIRFSDLVTTPVDGETKRRESDDDEVGSFVSANSRRKRSRQRGDQDDSESSDDEGDHGEGYSSFIVLEDDTTVPDEIRKLRYQFKRQLDFFVAGLRGVGRGAAGTSVEEFEMLADRLDWKK